MDWIEFGKFFSILIGTCTGLYILGSKLVGLYFDKSDELEKLKADQIKRAITKLERTMEVQSRELNEAKEMVRIAELSIVKARNDINENSFKLDNIMKKVDNFTEATNKRINQMERGEWIRIGENTWMLKGKRDE